MAQPTSQLTNFVGPLFINNAPPTVAELGGPIKTGQIYLDTEGGAQGVDTSFCAYNGSAWDCIVLSAAAPTTTSTSTTTSTTTTSTSTTTTAT